LKLDYSFKIEQLKTQALTHKSAGKDNNERLEFLGDSLVNLFIAEAVYTAFPDASEGQLSRLRSSMVKKETLADVARELSLGAALQLGSGELKSGGFRRDSILADALESLIAAIYLDSDFETCRKEVLRWFEAKLKTLSLEAEQKDNKTRLQEYLQSQGKSLPLYELSEAVGKDHDRAFVVQCKIEGVSVQLLGKGSSKKAAEQDAAWQALCNLGLEE